MCGEIVEDPSLVIGCHHRDHSAWRRTERSREPPGVQAPVTVHADNDERGRPSPRLRELQHGGVFHRRDDQGRIRPAGKRGMQREVVRFRGTGGKHDLVMSSADQPGKLFARVRNRRGGPLPCGVDARRIARVLAKPRHHLRSRACPQRRRCVVIAVDLAALRPIMSHPDHRQPQLYLLLVTVSRHLGQRRQSSPETATSPSIMSLTTPGDILAEAAVIRPVDLAVDAESTTIPASNGHRHGLLVRAAIAQITSPGVQMASISGLGPQAAGHDPIPDRPARA